MMSGRPMGPGAMARGRADMWTGMGPKVELQSTFILDGTTNLGFIFIFLVKESIGLEEANEQRQFTKTISSKQSRILKQMGCHFRQR